MQHVLVGHPRVSATPIYRARDHLATRDSRRLRCQGIPLHSPLSLPWPGLNPSPSPGPVRLGPGHLFRYKKAPAGMLLLRNVFFWYTKSPCGHATAQKCYLLGTKSPCGHVTAQICNCLDTTKPCGHVTAQKYYF